MSPLFRLVLTVFALVAIPLTDISALEPDKPEVPEVSAGKIVWWNDFAPAKAVGVRDIWVWLPPSYRYEPQRRYPVLYMHDGQNVFDRHLTNYDKEWGLDEAITRMAARGDLREWIVVGIRSPDHRYQALFPQKLYGLLPKGQRERVDGISLGGIARGKPLIGDAYAAMVANDLKAKVDAEFRTLAGPGDTAVMGSSMGGLMSLYLIAEYPEVFGQAAGLSTHLPLSDPEGGDADQRASEVARAFRRYFNDSNLDPARNRIYVDHGTATLDATYPPYFKAFDAMMADLGWTTLSYESRVFFGAEHEENAWAQRIDIPLSFIDAADP
ncbi:alpha/beta hydrolase [Erythrobacter sp. THAF29]|uniref:alpha/beta hydrolase n=1 Tax=Erythrobacter sp. THAF29 TaxID=2587851 RepID=UPI00126801E4|nr:alpha/beta fold hydrolase [Erythrobacter sp. THAF29]QFT77228.1 Putative esterase [Erythrobacter sp. THAF29]